MCRSASQMDVVWTMFWGVVLRSAAAARHGAGVHWRQALAGEGEERSAARANAPGMRYSMYCIDVRRLAGERDARGAVRGAR